MEITPESGNLVRVRSIIVGRGDGLLERITAVVERELADESNSDLHVHSIQGEGKYAGVPAVFLRTQGTMSCVARLSHHRLDFSSLHQKKNYDCSYFGTEIEYTGFVYTVDIGEVGSVGIIGECYVPSYAQNPLIVYTAAIFPYNGPFLNLTTISASNYQVKPGDVMWGRVHYTSGSTFQLTIEDKTQGWTYVDALAVASPYGDSATWSISAHQLHDDEEWKCIYRILAHQRRDHRESLSSAKISSLSNKGSSFTMTWCSTAIPPC